jgi:guanylate kinase
MKTIITLTGPSCSGKTTLEGMLVDTGSYERVISTTTRTPRPGEIDGASYYFTDQVSFDAAVKAGQFIESVTFNGNSYGVSVSEVERVFATGKTVVIVVEPDGQKQIKAFAELKGWTAPSVFVNAPPEVIGDRFLRRFLSSISQTDPAANDKALMTYSSRFGVMLSVESGWTEEVGRYDLIVPIFDEMTTQAVLDQIVKLSDLAQPKD